MRLACACSKCGRASEVLDRNFTVYDINKENAVNEIKCRECENEYTIEEGIIQFLIMDNYFSNYSFISNKEFIGGAKIEVGKSYKVKLNPPVKMIKNINVSTYGNFSAVADYNSIGYNGELIDSFHILTSESCYDTNSKLKMGDKSEFSYIVYASDSDEAPTWLQFLIESKNALISGNYAFAILSSEISFESYIDKILMDLFLYNNFDKNTAYVILESMNNIYDKVYKLLLNLGNIKFKEQKKLNKGWQKLVETRNKIAHGENIEHTKEEAEKAFEIVVRSIFYINRQSSVDNIYTLFLKK